MMEPLPAFELGEPGPMRDRLVASVLSGEKTATSWLQVFYDMEGLALPRVGDRFRLVDSRGDTVGVVDTTHVEVLRLADVGDDVARAEGSGFSANGDWRAAHVAFWDRYRDGVRTYLGDPTWTIDDNSLIVVEWFRMDTLQP